MNSTARRYARKLAAALLTACALILASAPAAAALESEVKAAYLHRFLDFVTWPHDAFHGDDDPLVIGVLGDDSVSAELARQTRDRRVHGRPVRTIVFQEGGDAVVHVLYVPQAARGLLARVIERMRRRPVLIVTDFRDGLEQGGTINFVRSGDRIQFEVSLEAASRAGLSISSRLLSVAVRVKKGEVGHRHFAALTGSAVPAGGEADWRSLLDGHEPDRGFGRHPIDVAFARMAAAGLGERLE
jgi:hypothetical protein